MPVTIRLIDPPLHEGAVLLISGRGTRKSQFPFGPFMIAGAFLVVLVGVPPGVWR